MLGLVLVSHSYKIAEGVRELAEEVGGRRVEIIAAGGVDEYTLGTNVERVMQALQALDHCEGILVLFDLGSALMSAQMAVEMLPVEKQSRIVISAAPLVEGAVIAAVEASMGGSLAEINASAEATGVVSKIT